MSFHLVVVALYSFAIVGMGVWTSRLVRTSSEFFVAGRSLGAGLVFSSMLAANIGAGSLFGASGLAYRDGVSAWWWVGSAGLGSLVFAFAVAPRLWALAKQHDFYTTGDYLEFRYGATVRGVATALVGIGSLALLAGQLIAGATILNLLTGMPRWAGALTGGAIMTIYFTSGGLLGSAWINTAQLVVMVVGLGLAVPAALLSVGGLGNLLVDAPAYLVDPMYSAGPGSGWTLLALTGPAFIVSPGLIQKAYGARSANAVRVGVAANALALLAFAVVPVLLGLVARVAAPGIENPNEVLPRVLTQLLPPWLGAIALAAVFSTAVDTCDAVLFMISSSATKDLYKRFINPSASDATLLQRRPAHHGRRRDGRGRAGDRARDRDRRRDGVLLAAGRLAARAGGGRPVPPARRLTRSAGGHRRRRADALRGASRRPDLLSGHRSDAGGHLRGGHGILGVYARPDGGGHPLILILTETTTAR